MTEPKEPTSENAPRLRGHLALLATFGLTIMWYFIFCLPLVLLLVVLTAALSLLGYSEPDAFRVAAIAVGPVAFVWLFWQIGFFIGPVWLDLKNRVGLVGQHAHTFALSDGTALLRHHRRFALTGPKVLWEKMRGK